MNEPTINVIIPARGGSKGIPRKNMQLIGGMPLIGHTIRAALDANLPGEVYVSSDDEEILGWSEMFGAKILRRPDAIADDDSPLADVARHHAIELGWDGVVGVFQPTSPLRSAESIRAAWATYVDSTATSLGSVVMERHNLWHSTTGDARDAEPIFADRVNRQLQKEALFRENGAIQFIDASELIANHTMISSNHLLFDLPADEGLDIDEPEDLMLARQWVKKATIIFRVRANKTVGSGHLFHCVQLAQALPQYDMHFSLVDCDPFVGEKLTSHGFSWSEETSLSDVLEDHKDAPRKLVVNDILDTDTPDIALQRSLGYRVVCIEDLGPGAQLADWVVNALYPPKHDALPHVVSGARYATLRPEFAALPVREVVPEPTRVLVTFGGTDPGSLSSRVADALEGLQQANGTPMEVRVILGPGTSPQTFPDGTDVVQTTASMASEMAKADVVVTSAGRTVFEAACVGTPTVVIAQNVREATHSHLDYDFGVIFLGLASLVDESQIRSTVEKLLHSQDLRSELSQRLRQSIDNRGLERIAHRLEDLLEETNQ